MPSPIGLAVKLFFLYIVPVILYIMFIPGWVFMFPKSETAGVNSGKVWSRTLVGTIHGVLFLICNMIVAFIANKIP